MVIRALQLRATASNLQQKRTMAAMLETPSRIWRRIEAIENRDMPSLPSLPPFEDSEDVDFESSDGQSDQELHDMGTAVHSTPAASIHAASFRPTSSTSSTARFAKSIASRSAKSSTGPGDVVSPGSASMAGRKPFSDSFNISRIPSLPKIHTEARRRSNETDSEVEDVQDLPTPEDGFEEEDGDLSISDALQPISRSSSPAHTYGKEKTPRKSYDYSVSLKSEPKVRGRMPRNYLSSSALFLALSYPKVPSCLHATTSISNPDAIVDAYIDIHLFFIS